MSNNQNIYQKLFKIKKEIGKVSKESENPFFNSKYMDINTLLEAVDPLFEKEKLLLIQPTEGDCIRTMIIDIEDPESCIQSYLELPKDNNPQKIGSAITYYRRYTLKSLLGIQEEDDDGNKAAKPVKKLKLNEEQFNRLLNSNDKNILSSASNDYSLTDQQQLDLLNKIEQL